MNQTLRNHTDQIVWEAIAAVQPDAAVRRALRGRKFTGRVLLVAGGNACLPDSRIPLGKGNF